MQTPIRPNERGETLRRGQPGYEAARRALAWNQRLPDRFPDVIAQANDVNDVIAAVRLAKREGLRLTVRSGGHSWAANHVRDGGLVLDVSRLREVTVDPRAMRATAGPGVGGFDLAMALTARDLFFPAGHCKGVCIGGYLLQGGFGWHGRALGLACESVVGLDLVTADGDVVHANEHENADLFWAARGAGPGFFAVVTRFHLRLYPKPRTIGCAYQAFSLDHFDDVFRFFASVGPSVAPSVELQALVTRHAFGVRGRGLSVHAPGIEVFAPVFADSPTEARRAVEFLTDGPLRRRASLRLPFIPMKLERMYAGVMRHYPDKHRYAVDNMWTHASIDALLPGLREIARTLPPAPSHMLWLNWGGAERMGGESSPPANWGRGERRSNMAFSMEDQTYIALYGVWKNAADDARYTPWAESNMRAMAPLATGIQLADENLGVRPARFVRDENLARLDEVRAERDRSARFQPWMGRP